MARNAIATCKWNEEAVALTFSFANGEVRTIGREDIPESMIDSYFLHGLEQKQRDVYAGSKTVDEAIAAFDAQAESARLGEWGKRREGAGPSQPALTVEVVVLMSATAGKPKTPEQAKAWIATMKEKKLLADVKRTPQYVAAENAIKEQRAAKAAETKPVDLAALLSE